MTVLRRLAVLLLLLALTGPAGAAERILSFLSDVTVQRNGDLLVTETIRVAAEGDQIKRGILRDFPTTYERNSGPPVVVGFDVLSVARDGKAEPYSTEKLSNGVRVRIGRADVILDTGPHEYVIKYRTTRQIGYYETFDELYWNATGTGWTFPIDVAEARITLPERVPFTRKALYTGAQGATGKDAEILSEEPGRIVFRTTRPLPTHAGLTVAAAWQKGVLLPPPGPGLLERFGHWLGETWIVRHLPMVLAMIGLPLVLGYYGYAWFKLGFGPRRGVVIPLFAPPEGLSAAAMRYVRRMEFDDKTFTAALLELAVNRHLKFGETRRKVISIQKTDGGKPVGRAEEIAEQRLFHDDPVVPLTRSSHVELKSAMHGLSGELSKTYENKAYRANTSWAVWGLLACLALMVVIVASNWTQEGDVFGGTLFVMLFPMPMVMLGLTLIARAGAVQGGARIAALLVGLLFAGIAGYGIWWMMFAYRDHWGDVLPSAAAFALAPIAIFAFPLFKTPTEMGRKLMDAIDGFRMYLGTAEEERLEAFYPPKKTPELFEKYLPYAVALDVENAWAKRFEGILEDSTLEPTETVFSWGDGSRRVDPVTLTHYVSSTLSEKIAAAATPPGTSGSSSGSSSDSSSSGSSGGGSSGGGGGGGSGW
jgi:uncharacterized membrane protein YgcG